MTSDWRWKIGEAVERLRNQYAFIGRSTGAPFLAIVYPVDAETAVLKEWRAQTNALRAEIDVRSIDVLNVTQEAFTEMGVENIVTAFEDPMPGSDPEAELGHLWVSAVVEAACVRAKEPGAGKPVVSLERLAALHPAATPRDVMQSLWDQPQAVAIGCPVVLLIPGVLKASRTYSFLGQRDEFMYRGDLL